LHSQLLARHSIVDSRLSVCSIDHNEALLPHHFGGFIGWVACTVETLRIAGVEVALNGTVLLFGLCHLQWSIHSHEQCELIAQWQLSQKTNQMLHTQPQPPFYPPNAQ